MSPKDKMTWESRTWNSDDDAWLKNFPRKYRNTVKESKIVNDVLSSHAKYDVPPQDSVNTHYAESKKYQRYRRKREVSLLHAPSYGKNLLHNTTHESLLKANFAYSNSAVNEHAIVSEEAIKLYGLQYDVVIDGKNVHIGCQCRTLEQWQQCSEDDIMSIDGKRALDFWQKYRDIIIQMVQLKNR